ncbi:MAG: DUF1080 domain-containing protein [Pirellulales bacterium]|nr:DUF1080 domain-containing protein [Pirellulales bacterium]
MLKHPSILSLLTVILILSVALPCFAGGPNTLTADELADGWIMLFDGETLFGWQPTSKADWKVSDGAISVGKGDPGLLHTTSQWGNFVLKVDFKAAGDTNSGVFLRTPPRITDLKNKANIVAIGGNATGSLADRQNCDSGSATKPGQWQTMEIMAYGSQITVKLDGRQVLDYIDPQPLGRGYIGLGYFNSGRIEFRNIKLKPLGMKSMFNGKDLTGWKTYLELKSVCTVTEKGELNIKNGKGQLETEGKYGDFTMQLDVFVNGKALNSGIFFRCIPGDIMNGYESQIHNGFKDGDRSKPQDCGTGGIFRRQNARRVVANDFEWFTKTIHVDGKHMAVWVNGYQVSDWTDNRKPNENPRRGLRLEPGTITIQGHDPTTDLSFRNLRIAEIPKR